MKEKWRVLLADDEPIIREGICEAVNWQELGMTVAAEAEDGEQALELALEHSVDIMLVDLNMPIMNGISVIKHVKEQLPKCKIIIITGHDEFTYAQQALRLNVTDYILKPANPQQLMGVLKKVGEELEADMQQEEYLDMASDQIAQNLELLREQLLLSILEKRLEEKEVLKQFHFLQLPEKEPRQLGVIQIPGFFADRPLLKEEDQELLLFSLENIILEIMAPCSKLFLRDHSGFMVVMTWEELAEECIDEIRKMVKACLKVSISLCFEKVIGGIDSIPEVYRRCQQKIKENTSISPVIRRAREYVQDHFTEPDLTLEKVAESLHVSSVYLSRMFKQELGRSFVSFLTNLRMKKAAALLNTTDFSILEIAEKAGYDSQHYFSTAFKKAMGVSPKQYRNHIK